MRKPGDPTAQFKAEQKRARYIEKKYGIPVDRYNELLAAQQNACAICRRSGDLVVDHDHETGFVRGLLCGLCNTAIGMFYDRVDLLHSAARYLVKSGTRTHRV